MGIILFGEERCRDWLSQSLGTRIQKMKSQESVIDAPA